MTPVFLLALASLASFDSHSAASPFEEGLRRTSAHYAVVEGELLAADTSCLSDAQNTARLRLVATLRAYRERADFGRGEDPATRIPWFVDAKGRRCAVAELLHATGEFDLVERVRTTNNHAWVLELAGDATFVRWRCDNGLSFDEAARIQTPVFDVGPGDTVPAPGPTRPAPGSSVPGGGASGPTPSGGSSSPTTGGSKSSSGPSAVSLTTTSDDGWWLWWEYAKLEPG